MFALVAGLAFSSISIARAPQFDNTDLHPPHPNRFAECPEFFANGSPPAIAPRPGLRTCLRSPRGRAAIFAGWDARRGAQWIARLSTSAVTQQTARKDHCPKGWSEIGRLDAPPACMGTSPCGASEASTHPDCAPTRPLRDRKHVLRELCYESFAVLHSGVTKTPLSQRLNRRTLEDAEERQAKRIFLR